MNNNIKIATYLALATAIISGLSNFFNKIAVSVIKEPVFYTTLKNGLVAIIMIGILIVLKKWSEIKKLNRSELLSLIGIGVIGGSVPFALYFIGLTSTTALNASLIHKSLFIWVSILAMIFLKEKIRSWQWLAVGLIFFANLAIGGFAGFKLNIGELLILIATLLWAIENIIAKKILNTVSAITVAAFRMIFGTLILLPIAIYRGANAQTISSLNTHQWQWAVLATLLLLGYILTWYHALQLAPASYVATLIMPATLITNILSVIFLKSSINVGFISSLILFTAGTSLIIFFANKLTQPGEVSYKFHA